MCILQFRHVRWVALFGLWNFQFSPQILKILLCTFMKFSRIPSNFLNSPLRTRASEISLYALELLKFSLLPSSSWNYSLSCCYVSEILSRARRFLSSLFSIFFLSSLLLSIVVVFTWKRSLSKLAWVLHIIFSFLSLSSIGQTILLFFITFVMMQITFFCTFSFFSFSFFFFFFVFVASVFVVIAFFFFSVLLLSFSSYRLLSFSFLYPFSFSVLLDFVFLVAEVR
mgnify:CR=1 FL=1